MHEQIRILVVDDEPMFVEALCALLETDPRLRVVASTDNGAHALELATEAAADVALVDVRLPGIDGIETTRRLLSLRPGMKVVVISGVGEEEVQQDALAAGATAFLLKGGLHEEIAAAVIEAAEGAPRVI